jgi:hypothetical protein
MGDVYERSTRPTSLDPKMCETRGQSRCEAHPGFRVREAEAVGAITSSVIVSPRSLRELAVDESTGDSSIEPNVGAVAL